MRLQCLCDQPKKEARMSKQVLIALDLPGTDVDVFKAYVQQEILTVQEDNQ